MPWSIFSDGGGQGAALTWAQDLLRKIGAPLTAGNEQFVYDWEVSEGGGGKYNPLNQGPVPGDPALTTTGQQYGGGAADYASWNAGLTGAADYLAMPAYQGVTSGLLANDPAAARQALIASPWAASHYGYGSEFSGAGLPGRASALAGDGGGGGNPVWAGIKAGLGISENLPGNPANALGAAGAASGIAGAITGFTSSLGRLAITAPIILAAAGLGVFGFIRMTGRSPGAEAAKVREDVTGAAKVAAVAA